MKALVQIGDAMVLHVALVGTIALVVWLVAVRRKRPNLPGPPEYPIVGALAWVSHFRDNLMDGIYVGHELWGNLHTAPRTWTAKWPLAPRFYFTADPAVVEHVLKGRFEAYEKGAIVRSAISELLGGGIFTSDGPRWKEQRRIAAHMFSLRQFRETIMEAFTKHAPELVAILDGAATATSSSSGGAAAAQQQIDLQSLFFRFTLDSIGDIAFGDSVGSLGDPDLPFAKAFDAAQSIVEHRFVSPLWQLWERLDGTHAKLQAALGVLHAYAQRLIDARRAAGDCDARKDVLSRTMALRDDETGARLHADDDAYLRDVVTNFMIAGRDTTAIALTWAWMLIATHPAVEARLLAEATALLGPVQQGGSAGVPASYTRVDYDAVAHGLPYTQAVFMETLRLFPSVPKDVKQAVAPDVLPDGTRVAPGEVIAWSPFATGRSRAVWGPDAAAFKPERWLTPGGTGVIKPSAFKFPSFNAGPRTCLGQQMATVEGSYVIALVVHRYRVRLAPDVEAAVTAWLRDTASGGGGSGVADPFSSTRIPATPLPYLESLTLPLRDGLRCVVARRQP